ncbi:ArsR/SmtB family transcription factor [Marisediminicola sp. LYQ85]|uniref:ArsR/SmtB family transcription factor n=1 Tax=Marisediminicola sp. LYQ85 TaxID=3391062 RepID=UPI003982DF35
MVRTESDPFVDRLAAMERRIELLEQRLDDGAGILSAADQGAAAAPVAAPALDPEIFWALTRLKTELPPPGGVVFTGAVDLPTGMHAEWQIGAATDTLLGRDWDTVAPAISALAHPTRLSILHVVANGASTVAELAALEGFGTTGQIYHHVNQLVSAGWLESPGRGRYSIPAAKLVPLLVILTAAGLY